MFLEENKLKYDLCLTWIINFYIEIVFEFHVKNYSYLNFSLNKNFEAWYKTDLRVKYWNKWKFI